MLISIWSNAYINVLPITSSARFSYHSYHGPSSGSQHSWPLRFFYSLDFSSEIISLEKSRMLKNMKLFKCWSYTKLWLCQMQTWKYSCEERCNWDTKNPLTQESGRTTKAMIFFCTSDHGGEEASSLAGSPAAFSVCPEGRAVLLLGGGWCICSWLEKRGRGCSSSCRRVAKEEYKERREALGSLHCW